MAIALADLMTASSRATVEIAKSINEAQEAGRRTVFLCHRHKDHKYVRGLVQLLRDAGWHAYVDWMDDTMPPSPNKTTAAKLKRRIQLADYFMFLATPNATISRWCPWEIGVADGVKSNERILVVQTMSSSGQNYGNEYLNLYRSIDYSQAGELAAWNAGATTDGVPLRSL